jgi:hypothetical protein
MKIQGLTVITVGPFSWCAGQTKMNLLLLRLIS